MITYFKYKIQYYFNRETNFLIWTLGVAFILRIASIYYYVPLFNQDELSILYDAISVVETGKDRWGSDNPFIYRSLGVGDYRPPLYFWFEIILYKFFHIDEYGARCVAAIFGTLGIFYCYRITKILIDIKFARIFSLLLMFIPIHILLSSVGFESNTIGSTILFISFYYFLKYKEGFHRKYALLSFSFATLSIYVYQSYKLSAFLIVLIYSISLLLSKKYKDLFFSTLLSFLIASTQIYLMISAPQQYMARASHTVIRKPHVLEFIYESISNFFKDLIHPDWFFNIEHCVHLFNIRFLFIQFILYIVGLAFLRDKNLFKKKEYKIYFFTILVISFLPQLLTNSQMNPLRNNFIIYFIACIISFGFYYLYSYRKIIISLLLINFAISATYGYHQHSRWCNYQNDLVRFYQKLNKYHNKFDQIIIEDFGNQPYVYLLYYCNLSPSYFQNSKKVIDSSGPFDHVKQIGKYYFIERDSLNKLSLQSSVSTLIIAQNKYALNPIDSFEQYYYYSVSK